jgi:uncharacterized membrane protein
VDLADNRHRLVVHLLNAPANDQCLGNLAMKTPAPLRNQPVTVTLPAGATVDSVWLLSPITGQEALPFKVAGVTLTLTVPEVRIWGVVVIDYHAPQGVAVKTTASEEEVAMRTPPKETTAPVTPTPTAPLTDEEVAAKAQVVSPAEWRFPPKQPLRVLAVHGRWYPEYGVERALARLGGAVVDHSWEFVEGSLRYYPTTYAELMRHHLVVVANVGARSFSPIQRKMLKDYVAQGGTVLFLGGWYAFGPDYHNSLFEEISPVTYPEKPNDPPNSTSPGVWASALPDGLVLAPGKERFGTGVNWAAGPRVFWWHPLTPKPGATVLLTADGKPLLVVGAYGKGRVAVFGGTVMGETPAGKLPFWQWDGWPSLLGETMQWLVTNTTATSPVLSAEGRAKLSTQLFGSGVKKAPVQAALISQYSNLCNDAETAKILLNGVAELEGDAPQWLIDQVSSATRPYVDGAFVETVQPLLESGQAQKVSLGLRVLGHTKTPTAQATLEQALKTGEVGEQENQGALDAGGQILEDPDYVQYAVRLGALEGLGQLGNPASIPTLRSLLQRLARTKSKTDDIGVFLLAKDDELYLQAALAALRCGDPEAAGPVVDALLAHRYVLIRQIRLLDTGYTGMFGNDVNLKTKLASIREQFSRVFARQPQLDGQLTGLPLAVWPALAKRIAAEEDPLVIPLAFSAFGHAFSNPALPPAVAAILKSSKLPAVAALAEGGQ